MEPREKARWTLTYLTGGMMALCVIADFCENVFGHNGWDIPGVMTMGFVAAWTWAFGIGLLRRPRTEREVKREVGASDVE